MQATRTAASRLAGRAAATGAAVAAPASTVHARAEVAAPPPAVHEAGGVCGEEPAPPGLTANEWATITRDDVEAVVDAVTARLAPAAAAPAAPAPLAVAGRYGSTSLDETDSDADDGGWAVTAARRRPPAPAAPADAARAAFRSSLLTLLHDDRVRAACQAALARDPNFRLLADAAAGGATVQLDALLPPADSLLPPAARAAAAARGGGDPLGDVADAVAAALAAMAARVARHAAAAGELISDFARAVARVARGPLRAAGAPRAVDAARRAADALAADAAWGDLLTVVAMAVVGVLAVTRGLPPPRRA